MGQGGTFKCSFSSDQKYSWSLNYAKLKELHCIVIGLLKGLCFI